jgi:hypothetical protein
MIPANIKDIYEELKGHVVWLHGRWILYRQLFDKSEKRIDLLNECASSFFYVIEDVLFRDVMLFLCKLTDPASTRTRDGNSENLSLKQLQQRVEVSEPHLAASLERLLKDLDDKCEDIREWRNKRLAHSDLITEMRNGASSLPGISRQMIEEALKLVREYMNMIENHYHNNTVAYDIFLMNKDADTLVSILIDGLHYKEFQQEKKITWDDWCQNHWKAA